MAVLDTVEQYMTDLWRGDPGDQEQAAKLLREQLDALIAIGLREDSPREASQPGALLQNAYMSLSRGQHLDETRGLSFLEFAAPLLRRLLADKARGTQNSSSDRFDILPAHQHHLLLNLTPQRFLLLDAELMELAELDRRMTRVVELKVFAGIGDEEIAGALACELSEVRSDWRVAKAWLYQRLTANLPTASTVTVGGTNDTTSGLQPTGSAVEANEPVSGIGWTVEQWPVLKNLFNEAVLQRFSERSDWLRRACQDDTNLETKVALLLAADQRATKFLEIAEQNTLDYTPKDHLSHSLECGEVISGRFKILRFVDSGGMGEVYEAWDLELQERVALKTIRPELASIPAVIERFKREVKQARGISHPNVCRVYDLFSHGESSVHRVWFLTMELLEGETLLDRIRRGPTLLPEEALGVLRQLVSGLAAAHKLGIVHRDFKSGNVMLVEDDTGNSRAVITDFGLALDVSPEPLDPAEPGGQGTPDYMAPEQTQNGKVGTAADQYALGVVMCEMISGRRPLRVAGGTNTNSPEFLETYELPPNWKRAISRCLRVRPEERYPDVNHVISALDPIRRRGRIAGVGVLVGLALAGLTMLYWPAAPRLEHLAQITSDNDLSGEPSVSRDGKTVAYSSDRAMPGNLDIWLQRLPTGVPLRVTTDSGQDVDPSISADGSAVVFHSSRGEGGVYHYDAAHGERLIVPGGKNAQYSPDGDHIAYWTGDEDMTAASGRLYVLSLKQGVPIRLAADFADARLPVWSADGQHILFTGCRQAKRPMPACADWWVTSLDGSKTVSTGAMTILRKQQIRPIFTGGWANDSVYFNGKQGDVITLWRLRVSGTKLRASGSPQRITDLRNIDQSSSVADNGTIAFSELVGALHIWQISDVSTGEQSVLSKISQDAKPDNSPFVSRNGRWLVFSRGFGSPHDLFVRDTHTGNESVFLESNAEKLSPIIDESGDMVVFEVRDKEAPSILKMRRHEAPTVLCTGCSKPTGWFDGQKAVFYREGTPSKIKMAETGTGQARTLLESSTSSLSEATWAPETQYLLFTASAGNGKKRVFAVSLPRSTGMPDGPWIPVTNDSDWSDKPRWSADGKTIFYLSTRDGFSCVFGQHFDPVLHRTKGPPFVVHHFHNPRLSPETVYPDALELSVAGDSLYLNLGEVTASIWTGMLTQRRSLHLPYWPR